jgi:ABC-type transporter Mla maintaining outer membrane lipid asymmetry ATPase subunit MlaF
MEKEPIIEFKGVTKRFDVRTILEKVDFKIYEGERFDQLYVSKQRPF